MTASLINGLFRGICVDNKDPRNLGRIRVQVPQILGTAASGWAFPAWGIHSTTVWPQDRLPETGEGVWVMFDSTSPDKMIWMAAFGALPLINQPGYAPEVDHQTDVTLAVDGDPVWNEISTFSGVLSADDGFVPNPSPSISLLVRPAGGNWAVLATTTDIDPGTGAWSIDATIPLTGDLEFRATFPGVGVYGSSVSETLAVNVPEVYFNTTLTLSVAGTPQYGQSSTFSGVLDSVGGGIPGPGATVTLNAKQGAGQWQSVGTGSVDETTGAWSVDYTIALSGAVDYQAVFAGQGIFLSSSSNIINTNTTLDTTTSTPSLPTLYNGTGFTVTGTVKDSNNANATDGTIELWYRYLVGADTTWKKSVTSTVSSGAYSLTQGALTLIGSTEWQVRYVGSAKYNASNSGAVAATVNLRPNNTLSKGSVTHSSAAFSWIASAGATHYDVERQINGGAWATLSSKTTSTSVSNTGLSTDTSYGYRVRPAKQDPAGTWIYGSYSATITAATGHPQQTDSGSTSTFTIPIAKIDSHRIDVGWGYPSDSSTRMYQGYFSTSYGGEGYIGCARYGSTNIRDAVRAACGGGTLGTTRQQNGTCDSAEIQLKRGNASGDGVTGTVSIGFRTSNTGLGGSNPRPTLEGSTVSVESTAANAGSFSYHNIGTAHGQRLGDGDNGVVCIYRNSKTNYANFEVGNLRLKWSWNYVSVVLVAAKWL